MGRLQREVESLAKDGKKRNPSTGEGVVVCTKCSGINDTYVIGDQKIQ